MKQEWEGAARRGDESSLRSQIAVGSDVDARDRFGQTALMIAALGGHLAAVKVLIGSGADLNVTAKFGLSALMLAVVNGHQEVAQVLASAGADVALRGSGAPGFAGRTAADLALEQGFTDLAAKLSARIRI